jgi:hypothetical protein
LHVRAASGHRFNDMNNCVVAAARFPAHAPHCGELRWHSLRLARFVSATFAPQRRDARMASPKEQACGFGSRWVRCVPCATIRAPPSRCDRRDPQPDCSRASTATGNRL